MPAKVDPRQKERIRLLYKERQLGPKEIERELKQEFGQYEAACRATIVREIRKLRQETEREFGWQAEEGTLTKEGFKATVAKRRKAAKPMPWTVGTKGFSDEDRAIISQVLTEALVYDHTIPAKTSIALARWIARLHKAYPLRPSIIIWYAAREAELREFLEVDQKIEADYRLIDRALQFQPWKGDMEALLYDDICTKEKINWWNRQWWTSYRELFYKAESATKRG